MIRLFVFHGAWLFMLLLVLARLYPCDAKLDPDSEFLEQQWKEGFNEEGFNEKNLIGLALMLVREADFFSLTQYKRTGNLDPRRITETQTGKLEQEQRVGEKRRLKDLGDGRRYEKRLRMGDYETRQRVGEKRRVEEVEERGGGEKRRRTGERRSLVVVRRTVEFNLNHPKQIVGQNLKMRVSIVQKEDKDDAVTLADLKESYRVMNLSYYRLYGAIRLSTDERREYLQKLRHNIEHGTAKIQDEDETELEEAIIKIPVKIEEENLERLAVFFPSFTHVNREIRHQPLLWYEVVMQV